MKSNIKATMTLELTKSEFNAIRSFLSAMDDYSRRVNDDADNLMDIYYYIGEKNFNVLENNHDLIVKITD